MNVVRNSLFHWWQKTDRARNRHSLNLSMLLYYRVISKLIRILWRVMNSFNREFATSIFGVVLKRRKGDFTFEFCTFGYCGTFLYDELATISKSTIFLDIGANIGLFSILASRNNHIEQIHAFEPDPSSTPYLRENVSANECRNVVVYPYAISPHAGVQKLYSSKGHSGASSMKPSIHTDSSFEISVVNEEFLDEAISINQDVEVFIKIDVEGHEEQVIRTLIKWQHFDLVTSLFVEFDIFFSDVDQLAKLLSEAGFRSEKRVGTSVHWDELWVRKVIL